jgi:hypothetical protein
MIDTILHYRVLENKDWATVLFVISFATVALTKSAFENRFAEFAKLIYSDKYTIFCSTYFFRIFYTNFLGQFWLCC